jgi:phytol kinase
MTDVNELEEISIHDDSDRDDANDNEDDEETSISEPAEIKEAKKGLSMRSIRKYDIHVNGELTKKEIYKFLLYLSIVIIIGLPIFYFAITGLPEDDFCKNKDEDDEPLICFDRLQILFNIVSLAILFISAGIIAGIISIKTDANIGYTRKTLHFCSFFLPFGINRLFPMQSNIFVTLIKFWGICLVYLLANKTIRRHFWPSAIIFRAIDRPDDRPYTLSWMVTQFLASTVVLASFSFLWIKFEEMKDGDNNFADLALILVLINGLGDGLAEPVGVRFGKHKYTTRALYYDGKFWNGEFTRSYEGSSVVFLVSLATIGGFYFVFTIGQLVVAFLTIPIIMTLTEAFAPRTWDNPFLSLIGGLLLSGIVWLPI